MTRYDVVYFKPYPLEKGQKITIEEGPRKGDWEIAEVTEHKVLLRCPFTGKELKCDRFVYFSENRTEDKWPHKD